MLEEVKLHFHAKRKIPQVSASFNNGVKVAVAFFQILIVFFYSSKYANMEYMQKECSSKNLFLKKMKNYLIKIQSAFFAVRHKYLGSKQLPIWNCNFSFAPSVEVCNLERIPKSFFQFSKLMIYKCKSLPLPGKIDQTVFLSFFGEMRINGGVCLHHGVFNSGTKNQLGYCVKVTVKRK